MKQSLSGGYSYTSDRLLGAGCPVLSWGGILTFFLVCVCGTGVTSKLSEATSKWTASLSDLKAKLATAKVCSKTQKTRTSPFVKTRKTFSFAQPTRLTNQPPEQSHRPRESRRKKDVARTPRASNPDVCSMWKCVSRRRRQRRRPKTRPPCPPPPPKRHRHHPARRPPPRRRGRYDIRTQRQTRVGQVVEAGTCLLMAALWVWHDARQFNLLTGLFFWLANGKRRSVRRGPPSWLRPDDSARSSRRPRNRHDRPDRRTRPQRTR